MCVTYQGDKLEQTMIELLARINKYYGHNATTVVILECKI